MADEWGPWIEHDGKGCPCYGLSVLVQRFNGESVVSARIGRKTSFQKLNMCSAWVWVKPSPFKVRRYRIRQPRGLTILQAIAANPERELEAT